MSSPYQKAYFLLSVATISQLPPDIGVEVAIVGRSNAGKSSILNRITQNKHLARVSKTPGRTQLINMFGIDDKRRLVDLPGYGYAKVPLAAKQKWERLVGEYMEIRQSLQGILLVMDIRHPLRDLDIHMLEYCQHFGRKVHILLNKADKLSKSAGLKVLMTVRKEVKEYGDEVSVQLFSALKNEGVDELKGILERWY